MSSNLERICTVDISLATPISNDANFDNSLIIGPLPKAPKAVIPDVFVINSLEELTEMGFIAVGDSRLKIGRASTVRTPSAWRLVWLSLSPRGRMRSMWPACRPRPSRKKRRSARPTRQLAVLSPTP